MPPDTALPLGLCGHASSACVTFPLPPALQPFPVCFPSPLL